MIGQKCDRCQNGFWNLGSEGCETCGCNTDFAIGGGCDQVTGQCQCLTGVIGKRHFKIERDTSSKVQCSIDNVMNLLLFWLLFFAKFQDALCWNLVKKTTDPVKGS